MLNSVSTKKNKKIEAKAKDLKPLIKSRCELEPRREKSKEKKRLSRDLNPR